MTVIVELLPVALWIVAVVMAANIIGITILHGRLFIPRSRRGPVNPVSWTMVMAHVTSFVMAIVPFPVYALMAYSMAANVRAFYERYALFGAIVVIVLVMSEIAAMYVQARHAMETEMDRRLGKAVRPQL
ncbi:hypothetical protein BMYO_2018 [Bifidobacterium myosotis]|uniref:C4-dicarboxylate ABC transporter n=1 Tax=Bifidobacterium myosotis TaxID=1630166 RepID=A0A261FDP7_9BIFI|nr:hypothetical protein [Bifidobacterium myosotis]OZG57228.1 hypothetical protein BMYO_2018 [Bifidobacterium myosotis]